MILVSIMLSTNRQVGVRCPRAEVVVGPEIDVSHSAVLDRALLCTVALNALGNEVLEGLLFRIDEFLQEITHVLDFATAVDASLSPEGSGEVQLLTVGHSVGGFQEYEQLGDLGVAESVAGIIIIGFSVDYTVHLGNEYIVGGKEGFAKRTERFFYASRRIVSTVAAGAMTTGGAGIFMFPAQLIFFVKMATLMVATIVLSYLYALGFFMGYLLVFGPEDEDGNVSTYVTKTKVLVGEARAVLGVARDKGGEAGDNEAKELELATVVV